MFALFHPNKFWRDTPRFHKTGNHLNMQWNIFILFFLIGQKVLVSYYFKFNSITCIVCCKKNIFPRHNYAISISFGQLFLKTIVITVLMGLFIISYWLDILSNTFHCWDNLSLIVNLLSHKQYRIVIKFLSWQHFIPIAHA